MRSPRIQGVPTNPRAGAAAITKSPHSSVTPDRGILEKEFRPDPRAVSGGTQGEKSTCLWLITCFYGPSLVCGS